jgi:organic radical activating enzyme
VNNFLPDLIVEATSICDRACAGCYAANTITLEKPESLYKTKPYLFLDPKQFDISLKNALSEEIPVISIRGGEPSLHPELNQLLVIASNYAKTVYLETHGKWLIKSDFDGADKFLSALQAINGVVKISFDRMHATSAASLKEMIVRLEKNSVDFRVAITEATENAFREVAVTINWVPQDKIIFQKKAFAIHELVSPKFGVISSKGVASGGLNVRLDFIEKGQLALA